MFQKRFTLETDTTADMGFELLAIHSPSESFFLAYKLNSVLNALFVNATEKKHFNSDEPCFCRFLWQPTSGQESWELIANHYWFKEQNKHNTTLFAVAVEKKQSLLPALSRVDYFLKLPENTLTAQNLSKIQTLNEIDYVYEITEPKIKLNPNLIFE
ncbi:MAG: IPExxxVDY family protein [Flavobacteriaceae bacterium]